MNSGRMQKLAGINEGTAFKNGKFRLQRWHGSTVSSGNWCESSDVSKIEEIAAKMYDTLNKLVETMDDLPEDDETPQTVWDVYREARKVIEKVKSL